MFIMQPLAKLALLLAVTLAAAGVWIKNKRYSFEESELIRISQKHIGSQTFGQDHRSSFAAIAKELRQRHANRGIINVSDGHFQWLWTKFGGLGSFYPTLKSNLLEITGVVS